MKQRPSGRTVLRLGLSLFAQDLQCLPISYHWQIVSASPIVMDHRFLVLSLLSFGDRRYVIAYLHTHSQRHWKIVDGLFPVYTLQVPD